MYCVTHAPACAMIACIGAGHRHRVLRHARTLLAGGVEGEPFMGSFFTWANSCPYIVAITTSSLIRSVQPSIAASQSAGVRPSAAVTRATRAASSVGPADRGRGDGVRRERQAGDRREPRVVLAQLARVALHGRLEPDPDRRDERAAGPASPSASGRARCDASTAATSSGVKPSPRATRPPRTPPATGRLGAQREEGALLGQRVLHGAIRPDRRHARGASRLDRVPGILTGQWAASYPATPTTEGPRR